MTDQLDVRIKCIARGQWYNLTHVHFYEFPTEDPEHLEVWCYTDAISYGPGETVSFHTSTTADTYSIEVVRDGHQPQTVYKADDLPGELHPTPKDAYASGCGWPVAHQWQLPADLPSGGYVVYTRAKNDQGEEREQEHWFAVRPAQPGNNAKILLVCATSTWTAYNEWGGSNHYWGVPDGETLSPKLSIHRPWSRGFVWVPEGAPRNPVRSKPVSGAMPRYEFIEYPFAYGLSKYYSAAGWAMFDGLFVKWAEKNGYSVDVITQHDLHYRPELLQHYPCVALVGHDEYWSVQMRDAVEDYLRGGGNVARFAANFAYQIRFEDEGDTQVCYKEHDTDPVYGTDQQHLLTSVWESPELNRPAATTFGLNALSGAIYAHWSAFNPRSSGGFTVYRPRHWVFEGTDLYFGDNFGEEAQIFGYEVDGVKFTFTNGLPYPTYEDQAPQSLEILAMGPACFCDEDHGNKGTQLFDDGDSWRTVGGMMFGDKPTDEQLESIRYGAGMMGVSTLGKGTVFSAGTVEWVNGLKTEEFYTQQITRNVLDRFTA